MTRPKIDKHPTRLTVSLDEQDYAEVCRLAASQDVSAAWIIRRAVQSYLGRGLVSIDLSVRDAGEGR